MSPRVELGAFEKDKVYTFEIRHSIDNGFESPSTNFIGDTLITDPAGNMMMNNNIFKKTVLVGKDVTTITISAPPVPSSPSSSTPASSTPKSGEPNFIKVDAGLFLGFGIGALLLNAAGAALFKSSSASVYSLMFYFQAMMLTPLLGVSMHADVKSYFGYMKFMLVNFSFLPDGVIFTDDAHTRPRALMAQQNDYLNQIGFDSGSSLYNIGKLIFVVVVMLGVYLFVATAYVVTKQFYKDPIGYKIVKFLFDLFTFAIFIRLFILAYVFILLCVFSEIAINNRGNNAGGSYLFALVMLQFCILFF